MKLAMQILLLLAAANALAQPLTPGWHDDQAIEIDGMTRYYRYYVPTELAAPRPPAVFLLHGGTLSMRSVMPPSNIPSAAWLDVAERNGFILMLPNGVNRANGDAFGDEQSWNDCRDVQPAGFQADDVTFLDELIDWSINSLAVDATRVYFTGASNGGVMSLTMGARRPGKIAALATFIANQPIGEDCQLPAVAVPILLAQGTADPLVPYAGGNVNGSNGGSVRSAADTVAIWRQAAGLQDDPQTYILPDLDPDDGSIIEVRNWRDAAAGSEVRWWRMLGAGHATPSIALPLSPTAEFFFGPHNNDVEGAEAAWAFLSRFKSYPAVSDGQWVHADPDFRDNAQGLTFDYGPTVGMLFVAWFTYTDQPQLPPPANEDMIGAGDQRWLTALLSVDGNTAAGPLRAGTGGQFDAPPTGFENSLPVGTMQIEFTACNRAVLAYTIDDPPLTREFEIEPLEQSATGQFVCTGR